MLRVRVLGELEIEGSEGPVELGGSWRASSLLAWLALHPGSHLRSDLAPRFWPEILDSSARASLRNSLWAIRRALGPDAGSLLATRERVGFAPPPEVWVDAAAFADHVAAGELDEALELTRGELLAGLEDEWVHEHRDAHREALSELLERLAERAQSDGDVADALALAKRRVALDPLDERAQRALIGCFADAGDRTGALAAYGKARDRLRTELGISVSDETRELATRIREGDATAERAPSPEPRRSESSERGTGGWEPGVPFPPPPRLRHRARSALVGRERELAQLRGLWSATRDGGGARLALLSGEAGIGKSRLAREIALEAAASGAVVLHGTADEDLLVPHQPLVTAFGHYLSAASPSELERRVGPRAADLAPIAPGLRPGAGDADGGPSESRRYRLFEAVASLLAELAAETGVIVVIDDLQWSDQSTTAILRHAFESRPEMALLVIATQRTSDGPAADQAAEDVERLHRGGFVDRIGLPGLSPSDVALLAEAIGGNELPVGLVRSIREETGGNPFFVQEVVSGIGEADALAIDRAAVPERVREVLNRKLERLDDGCLRLLTVAAVIGGDFALAPLERVSDLEGDDLTAALDDAVAADVIFEEDGGEEKFSFVHALLRRTLLERLTNARRRRIHARVADALEATEGEEALLEIAHHLCEARPVSDREKTLDYATRAATKATENLAYAEAVDLFTRARLLLPEDDERRRILALKRAVAYQALFHAVMDTPG